MPLLDVVRAGIRGKSRSRGLVTRQPDETAK